MKKDDKGEKAKRFEELEKIARDISDIRPLTPAMQRDWAAAKRTGAKKKRTLREKD